MSIKVSKQTGSKLEVEDNTVFGSSQTEKLRLIHEKLMIAYVENNTDFFKQRNQNPESQKKDRRLLLQFIELYTSNPQGYPPLPAQPVAQQDIVHCIVHQAGDAILNGGSPLKKTSSSFR